MVKMMGNLLKFENGCVIMFINNMKLNDLFVHFAIKRQPLRRI